METRSKKPFTMDRCAGKSGPRLPIMNQAGIKTYAAGTNSFPQNSSGSQNRDSPSPKKKQKPKRIKWTRGEYKQVMSASFYQALIELNQKIVTQNALMKFGEKKWANTDRILMQINWQMLDEIQ